MDRHTIHQRIQEFGRIRDDAMGDNAALLEVALFIEEVFGITLKDEDICQDNLGTHEATERFILKKLERNKSCAESAAS